MICVESKSGRDSCDGDSGNKRLHINDVTAKTDFVNDSL
jgi:hypothetical protein